MKKLYSLLLLFTAFAIQAPAQYWQMQNIGYTYVAAYPDDIDIVDSNVVWTATSRVGDGSGVGVQFWSRTVDGGTNWTSGTFTADTNYRVSNIAGVDSNTCYILTYHAAGLTGGLLFKTEDGGSTWDSVSTGQVFTAPPSFPNVVHFFDAANGFLQGDPLGGYYEMYTTSDSGNTWTRVPQANIPAPLTGTEYAIVNVYGAVGDFIYFGTNNGRVFRSYDRGLTWVATTLGVANTTNGITNVTFRDSLNGFAQRATTAGVYTTYRTTNGGANWSVVVPAGTMFRSDFMYVPGTTALLSVGASTTGRGSSQSIDDGSTWTVLDTAGNGTIDGYVALDFISPTIGYAGGFAADPLTDGIYKWAVGPVSLNENAVDLSLNAYPNPSRDIVMLEAGKGFKHNVNVSVLDVLGNVVSSQQYARWTNPSTVNLGGLPQGVYFVRIQSGNDIVVKRIVRN